MPAAKKLSNKVPGPDRFPGETKPHTPAVAAVNAVATPKQKSTMKPQNFHLSEFKISEYIAFVETGDTLEDVQRPEFWCHKATVITAMARITVVNRLQGWECSLRVLETGKGFVRTVLLSHIKWDAVSKDTDEIARLRATYKIEERPDGWRIKNSAGDSVMAGLTSKEIANGFLDGILSAAA